MTESFAQQAPHGPRPGAVEQLALGARVFARDGACGELRRVLLAPDSMVVTHLVVGARHHRTGGHLVPVGLVTSAQDDILLHCSLADLADLPDAETTEVHPALAGGWAGMGAMGADGRPFVVITDRLTYGDVDIAVGDRVLATDGDVGRVGGLVARSDDDHVTYLLLEQGHGWGRREVWLPVNGVVRVEDGIQLGLSRDDVRQLPARTARTDRQDRRDATLGREPDILTTTMTVQPRN